MNDDAFEWDNIQADANLRKHKISFQEARRVFDDFFAVIEQDFSEEYGEDRFLAIGMIEGLLIAVVYSERGERIRLISARRATSNVRRKYYSGQTPS